MAAPAVGILPVIIVFHALSSGFFCEVKASCVSGSNRMRVRIFCCCFFLLSPFFSYAAPVSAVFRQCGGSRRFMPGGRIQFSCTLKREKSVMRSRSSYVVFGFCFMKVSTASSYRLW